MNFCSRCPKPNRFRATPIGPIPSLIILLGECPAKDEDRFGEPFKGRTGKELDHTYLPLTGLPRSSFYIMNAVFCSRPDYSNPNPIDANSCMSTHLGPTLSSVMPKIIVPMGAVACSIWPEIELNRDHGLPMMGKWGSWQGVLFPIYHPAAGLRTGGFMIALMNDFSALGKFIKEMPHDE